MKKVLGIIGVGLIAGAVVYVLRNKTHKTKENIVTTAETVSYPHFPDSFSIDYSENAM